MLFFLKLEFIIESSKIYSKGNVLIIIFEGVCVEESEIILKSENLHPCK